MDDMQLGHSDVSTTISLIVLNRGALGVRGPADRGSDPFTFHNFALPARRVRSRE
jgi:hypothetical protein